MNNEHTPSLVSQTPISRAPSGLLGESIERTRSASDSSTKAKFATLSQSKHVLTGFIGFALLAGAFMLLSLPMSAGWLKGSDPASKLALISAYLQGGAKPMDAIRVADQTDPARLEPSKLSVQDELIAEFFSKKYRLAASEIKNYIHFAHLAAKAKNLDPHLVLAVMSIESNLNGINESTAGAQGLMQVLTAVHTDKLNAFGGVHTVFDPQTNIMVGATILADCIKLAGSVELGLKCYVGATGPTDGGYGAKVLAEKERIEKARKGDFDFSANNKVLIEMGLIAPSNDAASSNQSVADLNQAIKQAHSSSALNPTLSTPIQSSVPAASSAFAPATSSSLLPSPLPVTLPAPGVSASGLMNPNLDSSNVAAGGKK